MTSPTDKNQPIINKSTKGKISLEDSYRMIRILGHGTMSSVYLAEQLSMARPVALKILSPALADEPTVVDRFIREARAYARLNHPNIVTAIDFGEVDSRYFLTMEYIDGETLAALIEREAPLDEKRVLAIGHQVILALEHAATHNVIHRDVKPANIMICKDGRVKLTDFGLAILADSPGMAEMSRRAVGTPYYMAPEQLEGGKIDWRADQCSLGASLYEAVTGIKPFTGKTVSDVLKHRLFETAIPAWRVSRKAGRGFSSVLVKMMSRSAEDRYQSFGELKKDFERLASGKSPMATKISTHRNINKGFSRTSSTTLIRVKADTFVAMKRLNALLMASVAFILILLGYSLLHWEELAGPRPPAGGHAHAIPATGEYSFSLQREMCDTWNEALRLCMIAGRFPSQRNYDRAKLELNHILEGERFQGTVYRSLAATAAGILKEKMKSWPEIHLNDD
jgi:Serine/threonine protein kinase